MVDIHSHILWGMDDGSDALETSLAMLKLAADSGTTDIVATPHANSQFPFQPELVRARLQELDAASCGSPRIYGGCDFHLSYANIQDAMENPRKYTIHGTSFLLVEFADLNIPLDTAGIFDRLISRDMVPIVTHPERNPILSQDPDRLASWAARGGLLQVTAKSLEGGFGNVARDAAWKMMAQGLVHFVASDCHDPEYRSPRLDTAFALVSRKISREAAELLFIANPAKVIAGGSPAEIFPAEPVRRRSFFGYRRA